MVVIRPSHNDLATGLLLIAPPRVESSIINL